MQLNIKWKSIVEEIESIRKIQEFEKIEKIRLEGEKDREGQEAEEGGSDKEPIKNAEKKGSLSTSRRNIEAPKMGKEGEGEEEEPMKRDGGLWSGQDMFQNGGGNSTGLVERNGGKGRQG
ncbi:hypothetical protein LWI28_022913 [Acer negundo]|uniref:Uncharacterized protein n=1 Tax=Acer negundo TaxID=4023 RepID=A0AAD5JNA7_ACENE|nr:hypothetical protein LWI28_022913 [Acer negundo]